MPIGTNPITVNGSRLPAALAALLRLVLTNIGTALVASGWVKPENIEGILTMLFALATAAYGVWRTSHKQQQLITAARSADDRVARVKE